MKPLFLLAVVMTALSACSGRGEDRSEPSPATVKIDSTGVVVDTSGT